MRKLSIILFLGCVLSGCGAAAQKQMHPVVTAITITRQEGGEQEILEFTTDAQTSQVLNYLRMLSYCGSAQVNPAYVAGPMYVFSLSYSDGTTQTLQQKAERYFMGSDGVWREIEPYSGGRLARLLPQ